MERSLVVLKPDALERGLVGIILSRMEAVGLKINEAKIFRPTEDLLKKHYPDEQLAAIIGEKSLAAGTDIGEDPAEYGRMVLRWNRNYMMRGPVMALIIEGHGAIQRLRDMIGNTNPPRAIPGTIRFDYGVDSIDKANAEQRGTENLVHASGSKEEAKYEISLWFSEDPLSSK